MILTHALSRATPNTRMSYRNNQGVQNVCMPIVFFLLILLFLLVSITVLANISVLCVRVAQFYIGASGNRIDGPSTMALSAGTYAIVMRTRPLRYGRDHRQSLTNVYVRHGKEALARPIPPCLRMLGE